MTLINDDKAFLIQSTQAVIIKQLFEIIKPYIKECNIVLTKECIKISTMDKSGTTVTYIKLNAEKFEHFYCEKPIIIGIDTIIFFKAIKSTNRKEIITLYMDKNDKNNLGLRLSDPFVGKIKDYKLKLLDLNNKICKVDDIEFDCVINIPSIQFQQIIKDIDLLEGELVEIKSIDKQLIFYSKDGNAEFKTSISEIDENINKNHKALLQQNGEDIKTVKFKQNSDIIVQGVFKMSHLKNFIKASHLCDNMNILLSNDKPLVLEYYVADLGSLKFLLMGVND